MFLSDIAFWNITINTVFQLGGLAVTMGVLVWKFSAAQAQLTDGVKEIQRLAARVETMDKEGTTHSRMAIQGELELTKSNARQIAVLTEAQLKIGPDLAAVRTDLEWIKRSLVRQAT